jgi:hypothetical protein
MCVLVLDWSAQGKCCLHLSIGWLECSALFPAALTPNYYYWRSKPTVTQDVGWPVVAEPLGDSLPSLSLGRLAQIYFGPISKNWIQIFGLVGSLRWKNNCFLQNASVDQSTRNMNRGSWLLNPKVHYRVHNSHSMASLKPDQSNP